MKKKKAQTIKGRRLPRNKTKNEGVAISKRCLFIERKQEQQRAWPQRMIKEEL